MDNRNTIMFNSEGNDMEITPNQILTRVYKALDSRGYNPVHQIVGYIMSGDPSYITNFNNARTLIRQLDRYELVEELVKSYLQE